MRPRLIFIALTLLSSPAFAADAQLTDAQIEQAFARADKDKNGRVNLAEAKKFGITANAFQAANPDKDGSLDKKEFAAAVSVQFAAANPDNDRTLDWKEAQKAGIKTKKVFDAADPDKDGTLDIAEFLAALVAQGK